MTAKIRINRYLALAGFGARRKCEELIRKGLVSINGMPATNLASVVDPSRDAVTVEGRLASGRGAHRILVLNKPVGVLSTVGDSRNRRTVIDVAREHGYTERLFPVGRLDLDSSGILILTNDGDMAYRLTHPRYKVAKTYRVTIEGAIARETVERIASGVELSGARTHRCEIRIISRRAGTTRLEVVLREGKKRQIRRMFELFGHRVIDLERTAIGDLAFDDLAPGAMRPLTGSEERRLRELTGLSRAGEET